MAGVTSNTFDKVRSLQLAILQRLHILIILAYSGSMLN